MTAGYSGTPLARKLSLEPGLRTWWCGMPDGVRAEIERDAPALVRLDAPESPIEAAHIFVTRRAVLECELRLLLPLLARDGFVWVSWPRKAAKVATDISEDVIRDVALPLGLVDVKVCAVDSTWSGLKLVIRKSER
ncbi:hypothetical protein [Sphingomonas sp.]|uniref:hypothetical protein n=1 Tax=Sphingomonas sp. TaxID=28214 RepID=UPI0017D0BF4A|nr:hypothetical protein [Sphingomonas sp.]MBA3510780.1 hypothetical protein [Sphingomonas sp.]